MRLPPAEIEGARAARPGDCHRLVCWWLVGLGYESTRAPSLRGCLYAGVVAGAGCWLFPVLWAMTLLQVVRPRSRVYVSTSRDATLTVVARSKGWVVQGYNSAHPGSTAPTGRRPGRVLWDAMVPALLEVADRDGIAVHVVSANSRLTELYLSRVPGLQVVGRGRPRGDKLVRAPQGRP